MQAALAQPEFNPKAVQSITLRIVQSGTLEVTGSVSRMNLTLYVPQDGLQGIDVSSSRQVSWKYATDKFGNRIAVLEWANPSGTVTYQLDMTVSNSAKLFNSLPSIGSDPAYLNRTASIVINDDIRKAAFPFEKTWENVARLTKYVYDLVEYDLSLVGDRQPSDWVLANKRGVCVEHANLLASLLRASGIPTRYATGYAYSSVDNKLIGHTWVEVLASDGSWVPFDPTWLQGGFVDATHIKTANLLDDNQVDTLTYIGTGSVSWRRGSSATQPARRLTGDLYADRVDIIDYTLRNLTRITVEAPETVLGGYGYIRATVTPQACLINQLRAVSCVDARDSYVFEIFQQNQSFFSCSTRDVYWFYRELDGKRPYICPVTVFDQIGTVEGADVHVGGSTSQQQLLISGPGVVGVGEQFTLNANAPSQFIFYSPELGRRSSISWPLELSRQGTYIFYLYSASSLATKTVSAVEQKEFGISAAAPASVKQSSSFMVNVTVRNLLAPKAAKVSAEFDSQKSEVQYTFLPSETKAFQFNFTASTAGQKELVVLVAADGLTQYTATVRVEGEKGLFSQDNGILGAISSLFSSIIDFFANLF
jgi:hypothetical protein